jgi:membrane-bound inhibitor of C-type lysozyme
MKQFLPILIVFFLFSCRSGDAGSGPADSLSKTIPNLARDTTLPITTVVFDCDSGSLAAIRFWQNKCRLTGMLAGRNLDYMLPQVESGSGVKYSDGKIIVWNKGNEVFIDLGNGLHFNCSKRSEVRPE